tara:strand:- start:1293 stop:1418 length:126 start_codon:yes stop_codon:yes gene_type:complete
MNALKTSSKSFWLTAVLAYFSIFLEPPISDASLRSSFYLSS